MYPLSSYPSFTHADNWESLHSTRADTGRLHDIWDGAALRPLCAPSRFFSDTNNLALSLSTDGVPLYKSSAVSLWPVYLVILNLPARIRMKAENVLLCGLWVGTTKPMVDLLLTPITKFVKKLSTLGLSIQTCRGYLTVRAKLVVGIFDLPAKAMVLCAKQFNGEYGCSVCLHPGKRLSNNARVYLPNHVYPERTHADVLAAAMEADSTRSCVQGIFRASPFASTLDVVASIPIDYMHAVLEGVTRWLMKAWFDSKFHAAPFYIGRHLQGIDHGLLKQRPPHEFSRPPRSIKKHMKYWKASELRNWLLFYSLPLLIDILPSLYWHHFALLVCAMHILLGDSITHAQVDAAERMLLDFHALLPELYGEASCTANAHLLTHLTKYVRLWGPLWTHSAFGFESKNGQLKHLFHGKSNIIHQLLFNIDVCCTLQQVHSKLLQCESEETMKYLGHHLKSNMKFIGQHTYAIGQYRIAMLTAEQSSALGFTGSVGIFSRMLMDGVLYHSTSYAKSETAKRNNTYCQYMDEASNCLCFGQIELFTCCPRPHAFVRRLHPLDTSLSNLAGPPCRSILSQYQQVDLLSNYIIPVKLPTHHDQLSAVAVENILSKVVMISGSERHYCIVQPNNVEYH